ncbi:MAG: protein kinase [Bacteroidales bacterium]|nr:protein kinase [Bacteroidales bacterium]
MENSSEFFEAPSSKLPNEVPAKELISRSQSGYCEIWRVDRGGRFRVLKCLKKEYRGNPLYERLLLKEFEIGYSLNHRNICEYYSFLNDAELGNCIEMEWVDSCDLEAFLSDGKRDNAVCDKIVGELCSALQYMHAKQVLHRDLKPSNILITYSGHNVKLIDFGLSDTDSSTILKNPAGTAVYAAPEVRAGGKASIASDLYSLGMVLSLFPGRKYSKVAAKLCSAKPEDRYTSVAEIEKALDGGSHPLLWALLLLIAAIVAISPNIYKRLRSSKDIPVPASIQTPDSVATPQPQPVLDTMAIPSVKTNDSPTPKPQPASKSTVQSTSSPTDTTLIDELFRQATELFE